MTQGYLFGVLASVAGVMLMNYCFTYPYLALNFTLDGYPLTFFTMLLVSVVTSALMMQKVSSSRSGRSSPVRV